MKNFGDELFSDNSPIWEATYATENRQKAASSLPRGKNSPTFSERGIYLSYLEPIVFSNRY